MVLLVPISVVLMDVKMEANVVVQINAIACRGGQANFVKPQILTVLIQLFY